MQSLTQTNSPKGHHRVTSKKANQKQEVFVKRIQVYQDIFNNIDNMNENSSRKPAEAKYSSTQHIEIDDFDDYDEEEDD